MSISYTSQLTFKDGAFICPIPESDEKAIKAAEKLRGKNCLVTIENADSKSALQNRAYHALCGEFWASGCSSFAGYDQLRAYYIIRAGHIAYKHYVYYVNGNAEYVDKIEDLPKERDGEPASIPYPASWATINREKAMKAITLIINDMFEAHVDTMKFQEIMAGLEKESWYKI